MTIQCGDYVRPNSLCTNLPRGSVWRVICTNGGLKLKAVNNIAGTAIRDVVGCRFSPQVFGKVVLCSGKWVDVLTAELRFGYASVFDDDVLTGRMSSHFPSPQNLPKAGPRSAAAVTAATVAAEQAANATAAIEGLLEAAQKLEAERQEELRIAKAAKAKADKEAAARAKVEEARKALAAKLHADRCLGEATLALIAEVSRLHNGGSEQVADASIAQHVDQLQALAKSYGYRIAKPSMLAQVVKL